MSRLRVTQQRSAIGRPESQRKVLAGLGLRRPGASRVVEDTPSFRGMIRKVLHLVEVEALEGTEAGGKEARS